MFRTGLGYDSHRVADDRPLVLGGVRIAERGGLAGHSDADAVLHAVTDAILGAVAAGDIGQLFPDTDAKWKDAESSIFVQQAVTIAIEKGYAVGNCDVTVLAERPHLGPFKGPMRQKIAELLQVDVEAVSVKAKTNEGVGAIGRGEMLAAMAVVTLNKQV